jgi:hypothetical protein
MSRRFGRDVLHLSRSVPQSFALMHRSFDIEKWPRRLVFIWFDPRPGRCYYHHGAGEARNLFRLTCGGTMRSALVLGVFIETSPPFTYVCTGLPAGSAAGQRPTWLRLNCIWQ